MFRLFPAFCALVVLALNGTSLHAVEDAIVFVAEWGGKGDADGQFHSPIGIAISKHDVLYVTDLNNARIQKFDTDGEFLGGFALPSDIEERKHSQTPGIAIDDNGLIYVSFMLQHRISVFSDSGEVVRAWGTLGNGPGQLNGPGGLALGKDNVLYVADQRNHRIQVFSSTGEYIKAWGDHGTEIGQFGGLEPNGSRFGGPHFVAMDFESRLYTTEGTGSRVQRFDENGKADLTWGNAGNEPGGFGALKTGFSKNPFGPIAIMVDRSDRVWVSSLNDRVQAFSPDGEFLFGIGTTGDGPAEFSRPHGMAMDSEGHLYVCDSSNHRIQKFKCTTKSITKR